MNENIRENIENSRDTKLRERATRVTAATYGGFTHPGLFQTAQYGKDLVGFTVALGLEAWTLGNLVTVAQLEPYAAAIGALGLGFVDVGAALAAHCGKGVLAEARCRIVAADTPGEAAAIRAKIPRWHAVVRALGVMTIIGLTAVKAVSFLALKSPDAPGGLTLAILAAYAVVALLHICCTGHALAWLRWAFCARRERMAALRAEPRTNSPYYVHTARKHQFTSPCRLDPCSAHGHSLDAGVKSDDGWVYTLTTWGKPEDRHLEPLIFSQPQAAQKAVLAREFLKHQLDVLYSEPLGATEKKNITALPDAGGQSGGAKAAAIALCAALLPGLGACDSGKGKRQQFDMEIVAAGRVAADEKAALPADVIEVLAPQKPYGGKFIARPTITRLDQPAEAAVALPFEPDKDIGGVEKFWRGIRDAATANTRLREAWKGVAVGTLAAAAGRADAAARAKEVFAAGGFTAVLAPGTREERAALPGGGEAPAFASVDKLKAAIEREITGGAKRVVVLYRPAPAPAAAPSAVKSAPAETKPAAAPAAQLVVRASVTGGTRSLARELAGGFLGPVKGGFVSVTDRGDALTVRGTHGGREVEIQFAVRGAGAIAPAVAKGEAELGISSAAAGVENAAPGMAIGRDAVVLATSQASALRGKLTLPELARILTGEARDWRELAGGKVRGPIRIHACMDGDALAAAAAQLGVKPGAHLRTHPREEDVAAAVAADPMAAGILGLAAMPANLRALPLARDERGTAFEASACNVALGYYPLVREARITLPAAKTPAADLAREFAKFATGSVEGRRIAARERWVSDEITLLEPTEQWRAERRVPGDERIERLVSGASLVSRAIFFAKADATLDDAALAEIRRVAAFLAAAPSLRGAPVIAAGFADATGTSAANKALSERRAAAVAEVLRAEFGIAAEPAGFGERLPVASNATPQGQQLNRRVEILVKQPVKLGMNDGR